MRRVTIPSAIVVLGTLLAACAATPPPRWLEGGARLELGDAVWKRGDGSLVELKANGEIWVEGEHEYGIDVVGRIFDPENDPVAMLQPDGSLRGLNTADLGAVENSVGLRPGEPRTWVIVERDGRVFTVSEDGEKRADGKWRGCDGALRRTCTLVVHFLKVRSYVPPGRLASPDVFQQ